MQSERLFTYLRSRTVLLACVVVLGLVTVFRISSAARTDPGPIPQQDVLRLETRINQLEQRLFSIETSLRTVEQQSRLSGAAGRGVSQDDVVLLRSEIQALQRRLAENECAWQHWTSGLLLRLCATRAGNLVWEVATHAGGMSMRHCGYLDR